jgi:hypothetical protein
MDTLTCGACSKVLAYTASERLCGREADAAASSFEQQLHEAHASHCIWHSHPPVSAELIGFPSAQPHVVCEAFVGRVAELAGLNGLPCLGGYGIALLTDRCLAQVLALLDATTVPISVWRSLVLQSNCNLCSAHEYSVGKDNVMYLASPY